MTQDAPSLHQKKRKKKPSRTRRTKASSTDSPTASKARVPRGWKRRRKELEAWIDAELTFYVKDYIADSDYGHLRSALIGIAEAHADSTLSVYWIGK